MYCSGPRSTTEILELFAMRCRDDAGLRWSPLLGKTLFAPFSWMLVSRGESLAGFSASIGKPVSYFR
jgi:hypothetical protein